MVEVIAGLNAVSNAANSHNSGGGGGGGGGSGGGGEATSARRRKICLPLSDADASSTRSASDAPSFDDSVEYPVVGRDGILRACGVRNDEENRRAGDASEGKKADAGKKRIAVVHFSPDPDFTVTFER